MFRNNYDVTNKPYLERVQKGYKVNKESEPKENKHQRNKKEKKQENKKDGSEKTSGPSDKGNNVDFYA